VVPTFKPTEFWLRAILGVLCVGAAACGSVGEPLPPLLDIPGQTQDFSVHQELADLVASWTWPTHGSEGQVYRRTERFEVYAAYVPTDGAMPTEEAFNALGDLVRSVGVETINGGQPGDTITVRAPLDARYGSRFGFAVRSVSTRGKVSAWSAVRVLDIVSPPGETTGLRVETLEEGVRLEWSPVDGAQDYQIERRVGTGEFAVIGESANLEYLDVSTAWGQPSAYRLRARKLAGESPLVAGVASTRFEVVPVDRFPPAAPSDLRAIATESGVELSWGMNSESDLAGYRVLRDGNPVHDGLLESANYSAPVITDGQTVVYQIVSADLSGNTSAPAEVQATAAR
jgi:hypothetical protein